MRHRYDLTIVGMGSAGMVAAELAAQLPIKVAAVERDRVGGDCLWTGCVPSKALLASAKAAHTMRHADHYGLDPVEPRIDGERVLARVRAIQQQLADTTDSPSVFTGEGVDLLEGAARLTGPTSLHVEGVGDVESRFVLIATGGRPASPPIAGLEATGYVTSETLWDLEDLPETLISIGGGPIAIELSQAFNRLGVPTTVLQKGPGILPRDEPELVGRLVGALREEQLDLQLGVEVTRVEQVGELKVVHGVQDGEQRTWRAHELLVGVGRTPNVEGLGLEEVGVVVGPGGIEVDGRGRTAVHSIYAAGDVRGGYLFTHAAGFEAARAVRNMFFPGSDSGDPQMPWATFTDPELAHVGMTAAQARERHGDDARVWRQELAANDRARAESADRGLIVLVTVKGRLVGAHVLAPAAGEVIHELALAIEQGMKLSDLAGLIHVYPTIAVGVQQIASQASYASARRLGFLVRSRA